MRAAVVGALVDDRHRRRLEHDAAADARLSRHRRAFDQDAVAERGRIEGRADVGLDAKVVESRRRYSVSQHGTVRGVAHDRARDEGESLGRGLRAARDQPRRWRRTSQCDARFTGCPGSARGRASPAPSTGCCSGGRRSRSARAASTAEPFEKYGARAASPRNCCMTIVADVVALARDQRAARILRVDHAAEIRMRRHVGVAGRCLNSGICGFSVVHGFSRRFARPRQVRRADVHPAVRDIHARHVHAMARRAGALGRDCRGRPCSRCIESRIQNVRKKNTSWPRRIESRIVRCDARRRAASAASRHRPSGTRSAWCCCRARRRRRSRDCAGRSRADRPPRPGCRRRRADLRGVDAALRTTMICSSCFGARRTSQPAGG